MNAFRNRVQLIGYLGMDPELKITESGKKLTRLRIATNESYKNPKGEYVTQTLWHNVVAWEKTAESLADKLQKGNEVIIEGRLVHNEYVDKEGIKRYTSDIVVSEYLLLSK